MFLCDLFAKELDSLCLLLIHGITTAVLAELKIELVDFTFCSSLARLFILKLSLDLLQSALKGALLAIQTIHLLFQTLLVRASDVKAFD